MSIRIARPLPNGINFRLLKDVRFKSIQNESRISSYELVYLVSGHKEVFQHFSPA